MNKRIHISATLRATLAVLLAFSVVVVATVGVVHATGSGNLPDMAAPAIGDAPNAAELEDLQFVADQKGISLQTAIARYGWHDNFSLAVSQIREAVPDAFTGAEIVDGSNAWVAFKADAPQAALDIINTFNSGLSGVSVQSHTDKGFTEVELRKAIEAAHYAVYESSDVRDAVTTFDFATGQIESVVILENTAPDTAIESLKATVRTSITSATRPDIFNSITATVVRSEQHVLSVLESNTEHLGGEALSICTSGFGTINSSQERGISTAGHCPNVLTDDGSSLTYQEGYEGNLGDFQWHTGPDTYTDDFYAGSSTSAEANRRDVATLGSPTVGQLLCRNGKMTYKNCQNVRKVNVCNGNVVCNLVQMEAHLSTGGDSGGPVYLSNIAFGLHQGFMYDPGQVEREVFSRADKFDDALDASIATE